MEDHFTTIGGTRIHYIDHGGEGPPVVLLHGLTANARFFDAIVAEGLTEHGRVIAIDLRGRGLSDKPDDDYAMAAVAADVVGILDELDLERVTVCGHSNGGLVAYYLAVHHSERVDRCITLDAPTVIDPKIVEQIKPSLDRLGHTVPSLEEYLANVRSMPYFEGWWDERIETYFRADVESFQDGSVRPRAQMENIQQIIAATVAIDWTEMMARVEVPTLVVRATGPYGPPGFPEVCSREAADVAIRTLPDGSLVEVDGNHMTGFFGVGAAQVTEAIVEFIGRNP